MLTEFIYTKFIPLLMLIKHNSVNVYCIYLQQAIQLHAAIKVILNYQNQTECYPFHLGKKNKGTGLLTAKINS